MNAYCQIGGYQDQYTAPAGCHAGSYWIVEVNHGLGYMLRVL